MAPPPPQLTPHGVHKKGGEGDAIRQELHVAGPSRPVHLPVQLSSACLGRLRCLLSLHSTPDPLLPCCMSARAAQARSRPAGGGRCGLWQRRAAERRRRGPRLLVRAQHAIPGIRGHRRRASPVRGRAAGTPCPDIHVIRDDLPDNDF